MRRAALLALLAVLAPADAARAGDGRLQLGFGADMNYEDNVFSLPVDEQGDFYLRVGPNLRFYDERGDFQWRVNYQPQYLKYARFGDLDDWEQYADAQLSWVPSERTRLFASAQYIDAASIARLNDVDPVSGDAGIELTRQGAERTVFTAGLEHQLTRRQVASLQLQRYENDYELPERSDITVSNVRAEWLYNLTWLDRAGIELRFSRQEFGPDLAGEDATVTDYYNVSLLWVHTFSPTFHFNLNVGPALVDPEGIDRSFTTTVRRFPLFLGANGVLGAPLIATCPTLDGQPVLFTTCSAINFQSPETVTVGVIGDPPADGGRDITYFAAASLTKEWKYVRSVLSYVRDTSTSGIGGSSSVRDVVSLTVDWDMTSRWSMQAGADYQRFESATDTSSFALALQPSSLAPFLGESAGLREVLIANEREDIVYSARVRFNYELTPRTICSLSVIWQRQEAELPPAPVIRIDRLFVIVGFTYKFRSIPLGI